MSNPPHNENLITPKAKSRFFQSLLELNNKVMKFDPSQPIESNPIKGLGLNSYYLNMRHELTSLNKLSLEKRRVAIKKLYIEDFLQEERELNEVGLGYINTQP